MQAIPNKTDELLQAIGNCETLEALKTLWNLTPFRMLADSHVAFAFEDQQNYIELGCPKPPKDVD